jgi:general secretion pathway protein E
MRQTADGIALRPRWSLRTRRVAYDDVERVEDQEAWLRGGERLRLPAWAARCLSAAVAPISAAGAVQEVGARFAERLAEPFAALALARHLLDAAEALGATDIHVEPSVSFSELRLRLSGELVAFCSISGEAAGRLGAALKGLAGCLPYRRDIVQEGRVPRAGVAADVRASFVPTALGERIALRLFGRLLELDQLGFDERLRTRLEQLLAAPTGLILVAGGTGAGKTTTLYAALGHLARTRRGAHLSLEHPVEQRLRAAAIPVDQVELAPERGFTAEAALVAALRQDVDVLSVGEIRTPSEARLAIEAAHTGRLVLAGIHAGSIAEARQRMIDLGVDERLLSTTLRGVLWQALAVRRCGCAEPARCGRCRGSGRERHCVAHFESRPEQAARPAMELACAG